MKDEWESYIERIKRAGAGEYGTDHFMCRKHEHWKMLWAAERIADLEARLAAAEADATAERERLDWWQENPDVEIFADKRYPGGPWVALFTRAGEEGGRRVLTAATLRGVIDAALQATAQESDNGK